MAYLLDSKPLPLDAPFKTSDGTQYPANWLRLTTLDEKKAIGITETADPTPYDERFYWSASTAKELNDVTKKSDSGDVVVKGLKTTWLEMQKKGANDLLAKYDWYVTRKAEKGTAIPTAVTTYRDAVRTACKSREDEISAVSNVAALKTLIDGTFDKDGKRTAGITLWPEEPS